MNQTRALNFFAPLSVLALAAIGVNAETSLASVITWNTPTLCSADTDVATAGSLLYAYNVARSFAPTSVNGVAFAGFSVPNATSAPITVGSVTLAIAGGSFLSEDSNAGSSFAPYTNLPAATKSLLNGGVTTYLHNASLTLTLGGLTNGQTYLVQFWTNSSGGVTGRTAGTTYTAGNSVTLDDNSTGGPGGIGQWVTGTFTADAATEVVTIASSAPASDYLVMNGFQVRDVPEPSILALTSMGFLRNTFARRRKATRA